MSKCRIGSGFLETQTVKSSKSAAGSQPI